MTNTTNAACTEEGGPYLSIQVVLRVLEVKGCGIREDDNYPVPHKHLQDYQCRRWWGGDGELAVDRKSFVLYKRTSSSY